MSVTLFEHRLRIAAPRETVFELLSTVEGLCRWMAVSAEVELRPHGRVSWRHENGDVMLGRFLEIESPERLLFSYGWENGQLGVGPESTIVEITLREDAGATELHLVHRSLPLEGAPRHEQGWRYFLQRLRAAVT